MTGDQSAALGWTDLKHGSYIQGLIDGGTDPDRAYDEAGQLAVPGDAGHDHLDGRGLHDTVDVARMLAPSDGQP